VSCMDQRAEADARGRFRLRRLPLGRPLLVHLQHDQYVSRTLEAEVGPPGVVRGEQFRLSRKRASTPPERVLSELNGDELPALSGAPIRQRVHDHAPSEQDLLRIIELLDSGDVRVVSRLFDYDAGVFTVRAYQLKTTDPS